MVRQVHNLQKAEKHSKCCKKKKYIYIYIYFLYILVYTQLEESRTASNVLQRA